MTIERYKHSSKSGIVCYAYDHLKVYTLIQHVRQENTNDKKRLCLTEDKRLREMVSNVTEEVKSITI